MLEQVHQSRTLDNKEADPHRCRNERQEERDVGSYATSSRGYDYHTVKMRISIKEVGRKWWKIPCRRRKAMAFAGKRVADGTIWHGCW